MSIMVLLDHNITKILLLPILSVFMDGVLDGEESDERGEATARRDVGSDMFVDE